MISYAQKNPEEQPDVTTSAADDHIAPAPRCRYKPFARRWKPQPPCRRGEDAPRKAHIKIQMGGMAAATEAYRTAPTPNVIILETEGRNDILTASINSRPVCDSGTRVVVIGRINDVTLLSRTGAPRRQRLRAFAVIHAGRGPLSLQSVLRAGGQSRRPDHRNRRRQGGVGASTIAHNVAWAIARDLALDSVVADLDLAFGTAGLDYNQDPPQGIADAVFSPIVSITAFVDRLLSKCTDHLSLLAAAGRRSSGSTILAPRPSIRSSNASHHDAMHRARRSPSVVGMDQARVDRRRRYSDRRGAGSCQFTQHQEHFSTC